MEAFEKYIEIEREHHFSHSQEVAAKKAWRTVLEWVKKEAISLDERGDISRNVINRELEDK